LEQVEQPALAKIAVTMVQIQLWQQSPQQVVVVVAEQRNPLGLQVAQVVVLSTVRMAQLVQLVKDLQVVAEKAVVHIAPAVAVALPLLALMAHLA
jgi:hypothetical protein